MVFRLKYVGYVAACTLLSFIGFQTYTYFFDTTRAQLSLKGLTHEQWCAGDVSCAVAADKSGEISILLDDKPIVEQFKIGKNADHQFIIPTRTISNGKHTLKTVFTDKTFHKNQSSLNQDFYVDNVQLQAALIKPDAACKVFQGRTLHVQFQVNKPIQQATVQALSETYECFPESKNSKVYECYIPVACEEKPNEYLLSLDVVDNVGNKVHLDNKMHVVKFPFKTSRLHVEDEKVKEEQELALNNDNFEKIMQTLAENSPKEKLWNGTFCTPIEIQRVTTEFGTVRTTQHKGRYAHKALDVINLPKSVVWSSQNGVVVLKDRFANSGNTVVVDHGHGVLSMYFHLDDFANIEVGQKVAKGNPVGTLGKTGYAKGYHLHWEMRVNNIAIDPIQWTKDTF